MGSFPNNTVAQFNTLLPQTLYLTDGQWGLGLNEMMYANALKNITGKEAYFDVCFPEGCARHVKIKRMLLNGI